MWEEKATLKFLESRPITLTVYPSQRTPDPEYGKRKPWDVTLRYEDRSYHVDPWYGLWMEPPPTVALVVWDLIKMVVEYPEQTLDQYLNHIYVNRKRTREQHTAEWQAWYECRSAILNFFHLTYDELLQIWEEILS